MSEFQVNVFLVNQDGNTDNPSHKVICSESVHKLFIVSQCLNTNGVDHILDIRFRIFSLNFEKNYKSGHKIIPR